MADWQPTVIKPFAEYESEPTGPVLVSVIKRDGQVLGFLWADDSAGAAGYLPARDAGAAGVNLGGPWTERLRESKARGQRPSQALAEYAAEGDTGMGAAGQAGEPVPFEQLRAAAGPPFWQRPTGSIQSRGR